jgi:ATP-dependent RNA helicase DeaD
LADHPPAVIVLGFRRLAGFSKALYYFRRLLMDSPFVNLGLYSQFIQAVEQLNFDQPTPIQTAAIPALLEGRDVVGQAQTGTGKTAAFALPMLQKIQPGKGCVQALVLVPTRELAIQVAEATSQMACHSPARILAIYGGQPYRIQTCQLEHGVDVVVGTPGRLLDLIDQGVLDLGEVRFLVLDEADEMLEMGFIEDVQTIMAHIPTKVQTALFSATLPPAVRKLAEKYLTDPQEILIHPEQRTVAETDQRLCRVKEDHKLSALTRLIEMGEVTSALIFTRTRLRAQELADELMQRGYPAEALHGDLNQSRREYVLNRFRQHAITMLVATDVAARGLDIEDLSHVINYDLPADGEDYVHRIGRTGRAGKKGIAITFLTPREGGLMSHIQAFTRQKIAEMPVPTREDVLASRDERFIKRLTEQLSGKDLERSRRLVARLAESQMDLADIASAAIQLARAGESILKLDATVETTKPKTEVTFDRKARNVEPLPTEKPVHADRKAPFKPPKPWQEGSQTQPRHQQEPGMVTLWMNLGNTHGLRPGDVVGAIASEVGIPGRAIGEIDIRSDHTFVDVLEKHVRTVLRSSDGQYLLHGKSVTLRLAN